MQQVDTNRRTVRKGLSSAIVSACAGAGISRSAAAVSAETTSGPNRVVVAVLSTWSSLTVIEGGVINSIQSITDNSTSFVTLSASSTGGRRVFTGPEASFLRWRSTGYRSFLSTPFWLGMYGVGVMPHGCVHLNCFLCAFCFITMV